MYTAINYAFIFGKPENYIDDTKFSIGRFGVGMKRALFKIGKHFSVESETSQDHFLVNVDVETWSKSDNWEFQYEPIEQGDLVNNGTKIKIINLNEDVKTEFSDPIICYV